MLNALGLASIDLADYSGLGRHLTAALSALSEKQKSESINLLRILELNGASDCIWALRATQQNCSRQARLIAPDIAETVLCLFEERYQNDLRPRKAIGAAREFSRGLCAAYAAAAYVDSVSIIKRYLL